MLGYDLGSGMDKPLLSRSFAEFFRRWNYYIYESVRSLFLFPLVGLLSMLPLTLLQNWRLEHGQSPDDAAVERIVNQFYTPA